MRELGAKFWNSMIKIDGEIICQSWLFLTPFFNLTMVHCHQSNWYCNFCQIISFYPAGNCISNCFCNDFWRLLWPNSYCRKTCFMGTMSPCILIFDYIPPIKLVSKVKYLQYDHVLWMRNNVNVWLILVELVCLS